VLIAALTALALAAPAVGAATHSIRTAELYVDAADGGALRAARLGSAPSVWGGLFLRFADGPLAGRLAGPLWGADRYELVASSPAVADGDGWVQESEYAVRSAGVNLLTIRQTVRARGGSRSLRVTYRVRNDALLPVRFRTLAMADLAFGSVEGGAGTEAALPERFVGVAQAAGSSVAGAAEVLSSRLPGEEAAVPVPAWAHARVADAAALRAGLEAAAGPGQGIEATMTDAAAVVGWDDRLAEGLAPGAEARYEVEWVAGSAPRLAVETTTSARYAGDPHRLVATVRDALGRPVAGRHVRMAIEGVNAARSPGAAVTGADGRVELGYTTAAAGTDRLRIWQDADEDGVADPDEPSASRELWTSPVPALTLLRPSPTNALGSSDAYVALVRRPDGAPVEGALVRWTVYGANPGGGTATTGADGRASWALTPTSAGWDDMSVRVEVEGTFHGEWATMQRAARADAVTLYRDDYYGSDAAGVSKRFAVTVRDADLLTVAGVPVVWRVEGANGSAAWTSGATDRYGNVPITVTGCETGAATLTVARDDDGDGALTPGEPFATRALTWGPPLPRLTVSYDPWGPFVVGSATTWTLAARDSCSASLPSPPVRWSVTGANPTTEPGTATSSTSGLANVRLTARAAGTDTVTAWIDDDRDGELDAGEPTVAWTLTWAPPPPPLALRLRDWESSTVPATRRVEVTHRDDFGVVRAGAPLRWWVVGVNPSDPAPVVTTASGTATIAVTGARAGADVLHVHADLDGDGEVDAGEPLRQAELTWVAPPPPPPPAPPTLRTADGDPLDVSLTNVGRLTAKPPTSLTGVRFSSDSYYPSGFNLRFHGAGVLGGRTFGAARGEPFTPSALPDVVRDGDDQVLSSTYGVHSGALERVRVEQTVRLRDGDARMRVRYTVSNVSTETVRFRASTAATLVGDRSLTSTTSGGARRFVGVHEPNGVAAGLEEAAGSRWDSFASIDAYDARSALASDSPLSNEATNGWERTVMAQWSDRQGEGAGLAPGQSATYEVVIRMARPPALVINPPSAAAETSTEFRLTAVVRGDDEESKAGTVLRWSVAGANPGSGSVVSGPGGVAEIAWTGNHAGQDTLSLYADHDLDGTRDPDEPRREAKVQWRAETAVDAPVFDPVTLPDGTVLPVSGSSSLFGLTPSQAAKFPRCDDGSANVNIGVAIDVNAAGGAVVPGSMTLRTVPRGKSPELYIEALAPTVASVGSTYRFVIPCLRETAMWLCYTLVEGDLIPERFCVLIGGLGLWDPQGVVFDAQRHARLVAAGTPEPVARAQSTITGARVVLQRRHPGDEWRQVLSGDPFISPNRNPQSTDAGGRFGWNVSPGTYRVVVTADGYEAKISREAVVPPPDLELHVGLDPVAGGPYDLPEPEPPAEPEEPEPPTEPEEPAPAEPEPPAEPAEPEPPTEPEEPTPAEPEPPTEPEEPAPAEPEPPTEPAPAEPEPTEPAEPAETPAPGDPTPPPSERTPPTAPQPPEEPEAEPTPGPVTPRDPPPAPPVDEPTPPDDAPPVQPTPPDDAPPVRPTPPDDTAPQEPAPTDDGTAPGAEDAEDAEPKQPDDSDPAPEEAQDDRPAPKPPAPAAILAAPLPPTPPAAAPPPSPGPRSAPPAAPVKPAALPRLGDGRARLSRKGVARIALSCAGGSERCAGKLVVVDRKGTVLLSRRYTVGAGATTKLVVKLPRKALARAGRTVYVAADGGAGPAVIGTLTR
jgi:hypothetical protein